MDAMFDIWSPVAGEQLPGVKEDSTTKDPYAMVVMCHRAIVATSPGSNRLDVHCSLWVQGTMIGGTLCASLVLSSGTGTHLMCSWATTGPV